MDKTPGIRIRWQKPMTHMLWAMTPILVSAIYFFGWRVLGLLLVVAPICFFLEYLFLRPYGEPVTSSIFVTAGLFVFSLPPTLPFWMAAVGAAFGVVFGKMLFGGFGRNVFNPALVGRAFIYISFGRHMTGIWTEPVEGGAGGFGAWASDAITSATPGMLLKGDGETVNALSLVLGNSSGVIGGTAAWLVLLGGGYLLWKKAADTRIVLSFFLGFLAVQSGLWLAGLAGDADPLRAVLAGSLMIGAFFYATEPVTACKTREGKWIYGGAIGALSSVISVLSNWPAGTMFAILLANTFAPILDFSVEKVKKRTPGKAAKGRGT